jgi:2-oxoacid:acceptor oxidoreductase delta subunit (pyruvate/2-ketoisovalerate family)
VDGFGATSRATFFAGGDLVGQPHTVAHALGSGKRAAIGIDRHLRREDEEPPDHPELQELRLGRGGNASITRWRSDDPVRRVDATNEVIPFEELNMAHFVRQPREKEGELTPERSRASFEEVHQGLLPEKAMEEAQRCFNCGVCNDCELCLIFCPDIAITRRGNGDGFDIAYDYCKGCGVCAAECPRGAMAMVKEGS